VGELGLQIAETRVIDGSNTLLVFLTDSLATFHTKGEIKPRYYNPCGTFSEVHFVSPAAATQEIDVTTVQSVAGDARVVIHPLGRRYYATAWSPWGRFAALVKRINPDVVRAYDPGLRGSLAVYWGGRLGVPSIVSVHADLDEQRQHERRPLHTIRKILERYCLSRADAVICVTDHVASYARRYGAREPLVIYNRVFTDQFTPRPRENAQPGQRDAISILSVGRLITQKYQECLIRAVQPLPAVLTLIGDGDLRPHLEDLASGLGLDGRVMFVKSVSHAHIADRYRNADIFAMATHYEGFCIPVLEAMAAGLPIVASRIPPIEELVGDCGILVDNDPAAFTGALKTLIEAPMLRAELGARARARALSMDGLVMEQREASLYRRLTT
jgi:glycosyltransferase involved in cell wall biosynthesis